MISSDARCTNLTTLRRRPRAAETLPVSRPPSAAPCAGRTGEIPDGCPGWCVYADPGPLALEYAGETVAYHFAPGTQLPGPIRLGEVVSRGGMGTVYNAWHAGLSRRVAVKFLSPEWVAEPGHRARFVTETRALSRVTSPYIVATHGSGCHEHVPYVVMDFVGGEALSDRSRRCMPLAEALRILAAIARGLAALHAAGALHNDVKPDNVIVGPDGHVTIVDLGLSRPYGSVCRVERDEVVGTPAYVAPELAAGWAEAPTPATDLYALGVLAFEMLTGSVPFDADDPTTTFQMHVDCEAPRLSETHPDLPTELDALIAACLSKEPYARPPSASVIARQLEQIRASVVARQRLDAAH